jgi:hypothetical protein
MVRHDAVRKKRDATSIERRRQDALEDLVVSRVFE